MDYLEIITVSLLGLIFGSFATMASYRLVQNEDIVFKRSACIKCKSILRPKDLIPILSWLINKGRCTYCASPISKRYPLIELASTAISLLIYAKYGISLKFFIMFMIANLLLILTVCDIENYIIPDFIQINLLVLSIPLGILNHLSVYNLLSAAIGGILLGLALQYIFLKWHKVDALGMGDVKFFGVAGLYIGLDTMPIFFFIAGSIGVVLGIIWKAITKHRAFPFGPALAISLLICLLNPNLTHNLHQYTAGIIRSAS
jgi:leader peptidase (prepilin peptidase)/N-methyltransferase